MRQKENWMNLNRKGVLGDGKIGTWVIPQGKLWHTRTVDSTDVTPEELQKMAADTFGIRITVIGSGCDVRCRIDTNRRYIGVDTSKEYCETARKRIEEVRDKTEAVEKKKPVKARRTDKQSGDNRKVC